MIPEIQVWTGSGAQLQLVGTAFFTLRSGQISTRFVYDTQYLRGLAPQEISPDLPLAAGIGFTSGVPVAFRDCCPDRWGRRLIEKRLCSMANSVVRQLDEVDYLLGVSDSARQGALRFRSLQGAWLGENASIPPVVQLPALLDASRNVMTDKESHEELKLLLDAGSSSLGGARPKATVQDEGKLYLAKFSHDADAIDVIGLEKTMLDLEANCGIDVPAAKLVRFGNQAALLLERFDRKNSLLEGTRIPYLSAMSLLGLRDGESGSYLDYLEVVEERCGHEAVVQMITRICFSIAVNNTDDHLRNHGLLQTGNQWKLSPCFDVNPNPNLCRRQTAVMPSSAQSEGQQLKELAQLFGLSANETTTITERVLASAAQFKQTAKKNGVPAKSIAAVEPAILHGCGMLEA